MKIKYWTEEEIAILTNNYANLGYAACADLLGRTKEAVKIKANRIGLISPRSKKRTNEEYDKILRDKNSSIHRVGEYLGDGTKILHGCLNNHEPWLVKPNSILQGGGCPSCAKNGFDPNKPAYLYHVSFICDDIIYYKLGITNNSPRRRLGGDWIKFDMELVWEIYFPKGSEALRVEQELLNDNSAYLINLGVLHSGNTETLTVQINA